MKFKIGDRVSFTQDDRTGTGTYVHAENLRGIVQVDGDPKWAWDPVTHGELRRGLDPKHRYWWVQFKNAKPIADKAEGQKDDSGKLRMDLIPAKSLRLILGHVWDEHGEYNTKPATMTRCLEQLLIWRDTGSIGHLAYAASDALELCGGGVQSVSGFGLEEVARILHYGAFDAPRPDGSTGYGENNWQLVQDAENRYYAAALRHWARAQAGEERDPQSGHKHVGHLACCLLFLLYVCG